MKTERIYDAAAIRSALSTAIHSSKLSVDQIAEAMSNLLGKKITATTLYQKCASSRPDLMWPAEYDIAFCEVTGDWTLLRSRVERAGFRMVGPKEERLIKIGRAFVQKARAEAILANAGEVSL
jgi:hypothetical protein